MKDDWSKVERFTAPLRTQIVAKLRRAITEGVFRPGDRLIERELSEFLGVSRPSVREAIRQLEAEGLIQVVPNRGPSIPHLSVSEAGDMYDMRIAIEAQCARYFAERGTPSEIERLETALSDFEAVLMSGDRAQIVAKKNAFYEAFTAGSHSQVTQTLIRQLHARIGFLWSSSHDRPVRLVEGMRELRQLVRAIRNGDASGAARAARSNVAHARAIGIAVLERHQAEHQKSVRRAAGG